MISVSEIAGLGLAAVPDPELASLRARARARTAGVGAPFSVDALVKGAVRSATFRSNVTPSVSWDPSAPSTPSSPSSVDLGAVGRFVQPTLDLELSTGETITIAPAGPATGDYRSFLLGAGVAVAGTLGTAFTVGYLLGRRSRRGGRS